MENKAFRLENIALIESFFKREYGGEFANKDIEKSIGIEIKHATRKNILLVSVILTYHASLHGEKLVEAKIEMVGEFQYAENAELSVETFGRVNGPAIIFPYIREHLSNMSLKAGIPPIFLPPINFVRLAEEQKGG